MGRRAKGSTRRTRTRWTIRGAAAAMFLVGCTGKDGCAGCLGSHTYGPNDLGCGCHNPGASSSVGSTGSCSNVTTDPNNCGYCGHVCPTSPGMQAQCNAGQCSSGCAKGRAECDGNPATVCEADLLNNPMTCGSCTRICTTNCFGGLCQGKPLVTSMGHIVAFDAEDGAIVWTTNSPASQTLIMEGTSGAVTVLSPTTTGDGIAVDDTQVFVVNSATGAIVALPRKGGAGKQLVGSLPTLSHLVASDPVDLYFQSGDAVYSLPKAGGASPTLVFSTSGTTLTGLAVLGGYVYVDVLNKGGGGTVGRMDLSTKAVEPITNYYGDASDLTSNGVDIFYTAGTSVYEYDPLTAASKAIGTGLSSDPQMIPEFLTATDAGNVFFGVSGQDEIDTVTPNVQAWGGSTDGVIGLGFISKPSRALVFAGRTGAIYALDAPSAPGG